MSRYGKQFAILVLDPDPKANPGFFEALSQKGELHVYPTLDQLLAEEENYADKILLFDIAALQQSPTAQVGQLIERRNRCPMGLITELETENYILDLRRWGIFQVAIKSDPITPGEVEIFLDASRDPYSAFGLARYLRNTVEMYQLSISTIAEKNAAVERVINHFATASFDVHELYDVRLSLEELINNSFFHAFRTPTGEEKYSIQDFQSLEPQEKIRIEYGSNATTAGFTVTDNAGTLGVRDIIGILERQFNREGLFDISGRGIYLSRLLSSMLVFNLEENRRTQTIALFDQRRHLPRPKPFLINYIGRDTFHEWRLDPELD